MLLLSSSNFRRLPAGWTTRVVECLKTPAFWRGGLWLTAGFAIFTLVSTATLVPNAAPPAAQQTPPASSQASPQAGPATPQASQQAKPTAPSTSQPADPAAPQVSQQAKPSGPQASPQTGQAAPQSPQVPQGAPPAPQPSPAVPSGPAQEQTPPESRTAAPGQAPPTPSPAISGGPGVGFRLDNADLAQFINLVAGELKLNYIMDPAVKGAVTISTSGELKTADLFPILETVLRMNGATAVKIGNFYRIVPLGVAAKNPLDLSTGGKGAEIPADDRLLMEIIPLKFVFAGDMAKLLTPFLSEGGTVTVLDTGNTLVLVDDSLNVKRLLEILQQFDNTSFVSERVRLLPVRNNVASALAPELVSIFATYALSDKASPLRFLPLDRINAILVAAADPAAFDEVEKWLEKLDLPATPNGIQTFVYKVQYSEADRLVKLLNQLRGIRGAGGESETGRGRGGMRGGVGAVSLQDEPLQQGSSENPGSAGALGQGGAQETGTSAEHGPRVITDPVSNSIIVRGTAQEYADIVKTLDKLDILPRQVMIEARVYEVDLTGDLTFGLEYALQKRASGSAAPPVLGDYGVTSGGTLSASGAIWFNQTRQLIAYLTASENHTRVRTLSTPTILTTDSAQARIQVGSSVPVLTSQAIVAGAQAGASSLFTNTVSNQDTGTILSVTPRITSTGLVSLQINQEVSAAVPPPATGIQSPSFTKRSVTTQAVAQDGQTIALGGLISYSYSKTQGRLPLLGDIPYLGALFGTTSITTAETELIVLLTPHIISTLPAATVATRELENSLKDLRRQFKKDSLLKQ